MSLQMPKKYTISFKSVYEKVLLGDIIEREKVNNKMVLKPG